MIERCNGATCYSPPYPPEGDVTKILFRLPWSAFSRPLTMQSIVSLCFIQINLFPLPVFLCMTNCSVFFLYCVFGCFCITNCISLYFIGTVPAPPFWILFAIWSYFQQIPIWIHQPSSHLPYKRTFLGSKIRCQIQVILVDQQCLFFLFDSVKD